MISPRMVYKAGKEIFYEGGSYDTLVVDEANAEEFENTLASGWYLYPWLVPVVTEVEPTTPTVAVTTKAKK